MPARGCAGPAMGLLHMGQTQRTSSHFTRHLRGRNTGGMRIPGGAKPRPCSPRSGRAAAVTVLTFCGRRAGTAAPPAPPSP